MKVRSLFVLIVFGLAALVLTYQVQAVRAQGGGPQPISGPSIEFPATFYRVTGKVVYQFRGWYRPAENVEVRAVKDGGDRFEVTRTDERGNYTLLVGNGSGNVQVRDDRGTEFKPDKYRIEVNGSDISDISFVGKLNE